MHRFTSKPLLIAELTIFMFGVPLLLWLVLPPLAIPLVVLAMALLCYAITRRMDVYYARMRSAHMGGKRRWWNWPMVNWATLRPVLLRFSLCAVLLLAFTYFTRPAMLFNFVREKPMLWALVMFLYPLLSVVPQEIIFRRYVFTRFSGLLKPPLLLILFSGVGFGFAHIIFDNWLAPALCTVGGLMFAITYHKTRSLALVCIEHALYGNFIFTVGLGRYFYHGAVGMV